MKLFANFRSEKNKNFDHIEMQYSVLHLLGGNSVWFVRIWRNGWITDTYGSYGQSYGKTKFEAYRNALKDLNKIKYGI